MDTVITRDMLSGLSNNIQAAYGFLHPKGLTMEELEKKATEHTYYNIILKHVMKEIADGK